MLSFKDFTPVQYTGGETEMQDRYAFKRHHGVVGEEGQKTDVEKKHQEVLNKRLSKANDADMVKAHHAKLGPDQASPAQLKKRYPGSFSESERTSSETITKIRGRIKENRERRTKHQEQNGNR